MRSSKSRSRNKNNRSRSMGNIINRVFDSSGPEGKVRGTPQQIIDKYNQLAADAQLSNDRVAAENFQQHAEHYARLLSDAQREAEAKREQQERQNRERQQQREQQQQAKEQKVDGTGDQPDIADAGPVGFADEAQDSGLVETPEEKKSAPRPARRGRPKKSEAKEADAPQDAPTQDAPAAE